MNGTQKKLLALVVAVIMAAGSIGATAFASEASPLPFTDVSEDAWYYPHVAAVWEAGLFHGTSATTFEPDKGMTRAMFVQVLGNLERVDFAAYTVDTQSFYDVTPGAWYFGAVGWAAGQGLVYGVGGGNFAPGRLITLYEMALLLNRYITIRGLDLPQLETGDYEAATRADAAAVFASLIHTLADITGTVEYATEMAEQLTEEVEVEYFTLTVGNIMHQDGRYGNVAIVGNNAAVHRFPAGTNVTVRATPTAGYGLDAWFATASGVGLVSRNETFTFSITEDTAIFAGFVLLDYNNHHIAVTEIIKTSPTDAVAGIPLILSAEVMPSYATRQGIEWSVVDEGTTGATVTGGNLLSIAAGGTAVVRATVVDGVAWGTDFYKDFTITVVQPVTGIVKTSASTMAAGTPLALTADVVPGNATNQTIVWSVENAGVMGAVISGGNQLSLSVGGTAIVRATVVDGVAPGMDFYKDFMITAMQPVTDIIKTSSLTLIAGTPLTLTADVVPLNASSQSIVWSIVSPGATGSTLVDNVLSATDTGTVTVRATVINGASATEDFTKDFTVSVFVPVTEITKTSTTLMPVSSPPPTTVNLAGTVTPGNATYQTIEWSLGAGSSAPGAAVSGGVASATGVGTVAVVATVVNGAAPGVDFTDNFTISFVPGNMQTAQQAGTAAWAALQAYTPTNQTTQADIMAIVEGVITNPAISAWWATGGIIFSLTPATTSAPGYIS
ncbi:MAG: S-layer homology domain-containing protein [Defluviitaleaceae bacterium]|nr:S-layer homology domain-containing protein [Defluviitaleaceae bacterium]